VRVANRWHFEGSPLAMVVAVPYAVVPAMAAWGSSARVVAGAAWSHRAERSLTGSATVRLGSVASTSGRHHIRTQVRESLWPCRVSAERAAGCSGQTRRNPK